MATTTQITTSMGEVVKLINNTIDRGFQLEEENDTPIAMGIEGPAGIGKTSVIQQIAKDRNMQLVKLNISQLEEVGDITGMPIIENECQVCKLFKAEDGTVKRKVLPDKVWLSNKQLDTLDKNTFRPTGRSRTGYAKPAWVPEYCENGTIMLLDDYVRGNQQILQAFMEVFLERKFVSWSLPKKTIILLTNNPDDGTNNVNSLDEAQRGRFMNFEVDFDVNSWSKWAEKAKIDGRCINFILNYYEELFKSDDNGNRICNPRSFVMFSKMIAGIKDWDDKDSQNMINLISRGCFKDEESRFSKMFMSFIRNKMHLIIQPKEMLLGKWNEIKDKLSALLYDSNGDYRGDIASILERRFCNYIHAWLDSDEKTPISIVKDRLLNFIDHDENDREHQFFNQDLYYHMIQTLTSDHKNQTNKLMFEPKIAKILS